MARYKVIPLSIVQAFVQTKYSTTHQVILIIFFSEIYDFYATAASAMRWHIVIHLCVCGCLCACVHVLYRLYSELKKSSCEKALVQFQPNLAGLILG
jgi:hypothetical protein